MPNQLHYTYLDTFGRPVLVATKSNLVEQHIQDLVVKPTFQLTAIDAMCSVFTSDCINNLITESLYLVNKLLAKI